MINSAGLAKILQNPQFLQEHSAESLTEYVAKYPYCAALRLCVIKRQQIQGEDWQASLGTTALYQPDRAMLYRFLHLPQVNAEYFEESHTTDKVHCQVSEQPPNYQVQPRRQIILQIEPMSYSTETSMLNMDKAERMRRNKKRFKLPRIPVLENPEVLDIFEQNPSEKGAKKQNIAKPSGRSPFNFTAETEAFLSSLSKRAKDRELASGKKTEAEREDTDALAQRSLEDNEEVVSETLAKLLALQGQKEKAIKMYGALSLKFPEKSVFFAERIKILQDSLDTNKDR